MWSCGVTLYTMLVGAYPFDDVSSPGDFRKAIVKIISADFNPIPAELGVSAECQDLLRRIFVSQPAYRISVSDLAAHPWFRKNFPSDLQMVRSSVSHRIDFSCFHCILRGSASHCPSSSWRGSVERGY